MDVIHSHSPCILYTPRSRRRYPLGATSPRTQEVVPFPSGAEAGRQRRYCPDPGDPGLAPAPPPRPSPQQLPSTSGEGAMYKRGVHMAQSNPPTGAAPGRSSPDPPTSSDPNPMSLPPPVNPNKNLPTGPPPTRTPTSNTSPRTQTPRIPTPTGAQPHR
ncbi:hypothetical protein GOODEAATRI_033421 [Goodea atripinnis]|uniref:Uncharacterized protein n=1 Tax=Goodea atripinnis TaxID=208336 RepID=A0ABV0PTS4_9TELE